MFDPQTISEPVASRQQDAVRRAVLGSIKNGTFTYTDILMAPEPVRTMALEVVDGVKSANGIPQPVGEVHEVGPVRLVAINKSDVIKTSRWGHRNIFGTNVEAPAEKIIDNLGNDAMVPDRHPDRLARAVLRRQGWPIRNLQSRGSNEGSVVEWKWLEREAKQPTAPAEISEIYQSILSRQAAPTEGSQTQRSKSAGSVPAHP